MDLDLRYDKTRGIYVLNGLRVMPLPKGSLELIQDYVGAILGLATKSIFEDAMATTVYSFLTDLAKNRQIKIKNDERCEEELFSMFRGLGFGNIGVVSKDINSYSLTMDHSFNSFLSITKPMTYCYQAGGLLTALYRLMLGKDVKVNELKCKTTGNSDIDWFEMIILNEKKEFSYINSPSYPFDAKNPNPDLEKVEISNSEYGVTINSMPVEIVPVIFFPYLFSKLRKIIGMGVYGIQYGIGTTMSKLYVPYSLPQVASKYQVAGFDVLAPLAGVGFVKSIKNDFGGLQEVDVYDSFNALHVDAETEKRCYLLAGILTGLSYFLLGTNLKLKEADCSSVNNSFCKFSFEK